jgi:cell division protein FtsN
MKSKAASEVRKIKAKGLNVKLTTVTLPQKGGTWYRVMVGSYSTSEKAKFDTDKIKRITNSENCIIREN